MTSHVTHAGETPARWNPPAVGYPSRSVVVAEDDDEIRQAVAMALRNEGFEVVEVLDGESLIEYLDHCWQTDTLPDLLITDHRMPVYTGLEVLTGLQEIGWQIPVILITAFGVEVREIAWALGAYAVFDKPFELDDLLTAAHWSLSTPPEESTPS